MKIEVSPVRAMGLARAAVGVGLMAAPRAISRSDDPSFLLLIRTIGVRDLVLGLGSAAARTPDSQLWGAMTVASDSLDVAVGATSIRSIGRRGGLVAALLPVPFVAAGVRALVSERTRPGRARESDL